MSRLVLLLVLASCGCGPRGFTRYELDTEVAADGGWTRTLTGRAVLDDLAAPHAPDYQRVSGVHCAAQPPCPPEEGSEPPPPLPMCSAEELRPFRLAGNCGTTLQRETWRRGGRANRDIAPDFQRTGTIHGSERIAGNTLTIRRTDLGVLVFYEYRETYRQWLTPADVIDAGRIALDIGLEFALEVLRAELGTDYDVRKAELFLRQVRAELAELAVILAYTDRFAV